MSEFEREFIPEEEQKPRRTKIFIARHGEAGHNIAEIPYFVGGSLECDLSLVPEGIDSAKKIAEKLKAEGVEILLCSDLKRSKQTAEIIAQELGYPVEIVEFEGLREVQVGELTGKTPEQIRQEGSEEAKKALELFLSGDFRQFNFPGGENYESASKRARETLEQIIKQHGDKARIAIIGHGNINKVILSLMFPNEIDFIRQLNQAHLGVVELDMEQGGEKGTLEFKNVKSHGEGEDKGLI